MAGNLLRLLVDRLKRRIAVRQLGLDNRNHLIHVNINIGGANALAGARDRNRLTVRQWRDAVNIGHALQLQGLPRIHLDNDLLGRIQILHIIAHGRRRDERTIFGDPNRLYNGDVHRAEEALFHIHARLRQVIIRIQRGAIVDLAAHHRIRLVGGAEPNRIRLSQHPIAVRSSRSTGEQVNHKLIATGMGFLGPLRNSGRKHLRVTSTGEARNANFIAMIHELGGVISRHDLASKLGIRNAFRHEIPPMKLRPQGCEYP